jgi:hypothetical protein
MRGRGSGRSVQDARAALLKRGHSSLPANEAKRGAEATRSSTDAMLAEAELVLVDATASELASKLQDAIDAKTKVDDFKALQRELGTSTAAIEPLQTPLFLATSASFVADLADNPTPDSDGLRRLLRSSNRVSEFVVHNWRPYLPPAEVAGLLAAIHTSGAQLRILSLSWDRVGDMGTAVLCASLRNSEWANSLTSLLLDGATLTVQSLRMLRGVLFASGARTALQPRGLSFSASFNVVSNLNTSVGGERGGPMERNEVTDAQTQAATPRLRHLSLRDNDFSGAHVSDAQDDDVIDFVSDAAATLLSLDLGFCNLRERTVVGILQALPYQNYVYVGLDNAHVSVPNLVTALDQLGGNKSIQCLSMCYSAALTSKLIRDRLRAFERRNADLAIARGHPVGRRASPFIALAPPKQTGAAGAAGTNDNMDEGGGRTQFTPGGSAIDPDVLVHQRSIDASAGHALEQLGWSSALPPGYRPYRSNTAFGGGA